MYTRILVPIDGSELSARGLHVALDLAAALKARLDILNVSEPWAIGMYDTMGWTVGYQSTPEYKQQRQKEAREILEPARELAAKAGVDVDTCHVLDRHAADAILETAQDRGNDLIVMASHGRRGVSRMLLGSQTAEVLGHAKVPVLVVR